MINRIILMKEINIIRRGQLLPTDAIRYDVYIIILLYFSINYYFCNFVFPDNKKINVIIKFKSMYIIELPI